MTSTILWTYQYVIFTYFFPSTSLFRYFTGSLENKRKVCALSHSPWEGQAGNGILKVEIKLARETWQLPLVREHVHHLYSHPFTCKGKHGKLTSGGDITHLLKKGLAVPQGKGCGCSAFPDWIIGKMERSGTQVLDAHIHHQHLPKERRIKGKWQESSHGSRSSANHTLLAHCLGDA